MTTVAVGEATRRPTGGRSAVVVLTNGVGAAAAGTGFSLWALPALAAIDSTEIMATTLHARDAVGAIVVVLGLGVGLLPGLPRVGWLVAAAGMLAPGVITAPVVNAGEFGGAVAGSLVLAGFLAALRQAGPGSRVAMSAGLALGMVVGRGVVAPFGEVVAWFVGDARSPQLVTTGALALAGVVIVVGGGRPAAGVAAGSAGRADTFRPATGARAPVGLALVAAGVGAALHVVAVVVLRELAYSPDGSISTRRANAVQMLDRISHLAIATIAVLILLVYAYRRGGAALARWVVVCVAAGTALVIVPWGSVGPGWRLAVAAALGALAGAGIATVGARYVPWEAFGMVFVGMALLLLSAANALPAGADSLVPLGLAAALSFAPAAALARLVADRGSRGLETPLHLAASVGVGLAAAVLGLHLVAPMIARLVAVSAPPRFGAALVVTGAAVLSLALFGLGRLADRSRAAETAG